MHAEVRFETDRGDEFGWTDSEQNRGSGLTDWLVRCGIGKNTQQAEYILVGICVVLTSAALFFAFHPRKAVPHLSPETLNAMKPPATQ